jgi:hypothetical protein
MICSFTAYLVSIPEVFEGKSITRTCGAFAEVTDCSILAAKMQLPSRSESG